MRRLHLHRCPGGFTLLELMLTLALATLLLTLALPSYGDFTARHRLLAASESMAQDLGLARLEAAQRGVPVYVVPQAGPEWCYAISTTPDCDCRHAGSDCALRRVDRQDRTGVELVRAETVAFDPEGGRGNGSRAGAWRAGHGYEAEVHVHPVGRPRVCTEGAAIRGLPAC